MSKKIKIITILGPTASGKTSLAVDLCFNFNGEVVSADSRQVYKYMDIGSGKDLAEYSFKTEDEQKIKIPYHLIDIVRPNDVYDLAKWLNDAKIAIRDIDSRNRVPFLAGGTGLYAQALLDAYNLSKTPSDQKLRDVLEKLNVDQLFAELKSLNTSEAIALNNSDKNNKRRLIRLVEIQKSNTNQISLAKRLESSYDALLIGISCPREDLRKRIYKRLIDRLDYERMIEEVKELHEKRNVSWQRLESFGLEYKYIAQYLQEKISHQEMIEKIYTSSCQFAKRQMSWLRRWEKQGATINWITKRDEARNLSEAFLSS